jgi:hypothetical protein
VAYGYSKRVTQGLSCPVELPAKFDDALSGATYTIVSPPAFATLSGGTAGYRVLTVPPNACGADQFTFRVQTPSGLSNTATVSLTYGTTSPCPVDVDRDGVLSVADFSAYLGFFATGSLQADMDGSCALNVADFTAFLLKFAAGCP